MRGELIEASGQRVGVCEKIASRDVDRRPA